MQLIPKGIALTATLFAFSGSAQAGWYAKQEASGGQGKTKMTAEMFYENGALRIDQVLAASNQSTSVIVQMKDGKMTLLNHGQKAFHTMSIDDLVKAQKGMIEGLKAMKDRLPPEEQKKLEAQLKQLEAKKDPPTPKPTGKKDKVAGFVCDFYTWKTDTSEGEVCLAKKTGIDMKSFAEDAARLGKTLSSFANADQGAMAFLTLADKGFPVRVKQRMKVQPPGAPQAIWIESSSEVQELKAMKVPAAKFAVPDGYAEQQIPKMPSMPPPPPQAPAGK